MKWQNHYSFSIISAFKQTLGQIIAGTPTVAVLFCVISSQAKTVSKLPFQNGTELLHKITFTTSFSGYLISLSQLSSFKGSFSVVA